MKGITREPVSWEGQPRRVLSLRIVGGAMSTPTFSTPRDWKNLQESVRS